MRTQAKYWIPAIVIAAALVFPLKHLLSESQRSKVELQPPSVSRTVAVVKAKRENLTRRVEFTAELMPYQYVNLYAKVAGYLRTISVDIGDRVKAGQVLATLDLPEQEADLARAKAAYEKAKLNYDQLRAVGEKTPGLVAAKEIDNARMDGEAAKANLEHAQVLVNYNKIVAPFDGVITKRYVHPGALIQAGVSSSTQAMPVVNLTETSKLRLDFPVPEAEVPKVKPGTPATIRIGATGQIIHSAIARTAGKLDDATRTMLTEIELDNPSQQLTPGMYAEVTLDLDARKAVIAVPAQALAGKDKSTAWVVNDAHTLEKRTVTLGLQTPDEVEISSGLKEGELVVFGNFSGLTAGEKVTPKLMQEGEFQAAPAQ